jgi:hypothetical protein
VGPASAPEGDAEMGEVKMDRPAFVAKPVKEVKAGLELRAQRDERVASHRVRVPAVMLFEIDGVDVKMMLKPMMLMMIMITMMLTVACRRGAVCCCQPQGCKGCLEGLTFVVSGALASLERDEVTKIIEAYGGKASSAVGSKTSYLVVGFEPGQSKVDKAKKKKTPIIDEDGLLELISHLSPDTEAKLTVNLKPLAKASVTVTGSVKMAPEEKIERAAKVRPLPDCQPYALAPMPRIENPPTRSSVPPSSVPPNLESLTLNPSPLGGEGARTAAVGRQAQADEHGAPSRQH